MAIQLRRGTNAQWEALKSNIVVGELATTYDSERAFLGTGEGTYFEMANIELIADEFDSSVSYAEGDVCIYQGKLYQFTANHSGAWSGTDVEQVTASEVGSGGTAISDLQDNALIHRTASGSIASFSDGSDMPMDSLIADINPVQNLNGYSHPWSGGGGKNKLEVKNHTQTLNGVTFTVNADGTVTVNGTASANTYFAFYGALSDAIDVPDGDYILSGCPSGGSTTTYYIQANNGSWRNDTGNGVAITSTGQNIKQCAIAVKSGTTVNNLVFRPMLRLATEADATFAPYSNICPISGWDSVDVNVVGKNKLPFFTSGSLNGVTFTVASDGSVKASGKASSTVNYAFIFTVAKTGSYTLSGCPSGGGASSYQLWIYDNNTSTSVGMDDTGSGKTGTLDSTHTYSVRIRYANGYTANQTFYPMLRLATEADATYEPYNGNTTTVDLGQTVYGGSLNVTTGVLTITHERYAFTGNETITSSAYVGHTRFSCQALTNLADNNNNNNNYCSHFVPATSPVGNNATDNAIAVYNRGLYWRADQFADVTAMKSYFSTQASGGTPVTYVAKLATPITVQLTPTQVNSLLGQNNVWADSGDVEVTYTANASLTIEEIINAITALGGNV